MKNGKTARNWETNRWRPEPSCSPLLLCYCGRRPQWMDRRWEQRNERLQKRCIREKKEDWEKKKDSGVTGGERLDKRWAVCILMLPDCLYGRCQTVRGIVWVKNPLKRWEVHDSVLGWWPRRVTHSFLICTPKVPSNTPAAFNPPSSSACCH